MSLQSNLNSDEVLHKPSKTKAKIKQELLLNIHHKNLKQKFSSRIKKQHFEQQNFGFIKPKRQNLKKSFN